MIIVNNGRNPLNHGEYKLPKGAQADIPDEIAKIWLEIPGVTRYIAPAELEKAKEEAEAQAKAENEALKAEIEKLKAELEKAKGEGNELSELDTLKAEATALGIEFAPNIGAAKLREKIEAKKNKV